MEQSTVIKYVAAAVAAYVVYRYVQSLGLFESIAPAQPAPATQQPAQPAQQSANPETPDDQYRKAATDESYARSAPLSLALTVDQWNWYRAAVTGQAQPDPLLMGFDGQTRSYPITARQYWDALASGAGAAGLSGWGSLAGVVM